MRLTFLVCAIACLPVWLASQSFQGTSVQPSQDGAPVFRTGVESVRFDAFVTDRKGEPVAGLTADDFDVYEDDHLQVVQQFSPIALPLPARSSTPQAARVRRDVALNDEDQNRIYVIVFDTLSWAGRGAGHEDLRPSVRGRTAAGKRAAGILSAAGRRAFELRHVALGDARSS